MEAAEFTITTDCVAPASETWQRLWDLTRHSAAIPLTHVFSHRDQELGPGVRFIARTGIGPLHFDDRMVVRQWEEPSRAVIAKVGSYLRALITIELDDNNGVTRVCWKQRYRIVYMPACISHMINPVIRHAYRRALDKILA
ncbi:MAG: hypothetical protein Q4Q03_04675 [Bowdeniella nasicola]|nr:hypothetical protein [Bowdeniella nasicola]